MRASCSVGRLRALRVMLMLMAAVESATVRAEEPYLALIEHGIEEYKLSHWVEAKSYFERAHALQPNARTLRGLGLVSFELRQYVPAVKYLSQALTSQERPLTTDMRVGAEKLLASARGFIAYYRLELEPRDTQLEIDGQPPLFDEQGWLMLEAASHELVFSAPEHQSIVRAVTATAGTRVTLHVALERKALSPRPEAEPLAEPAASPRQTTARQSAWSWRRWSTVGIAGAGALSLVAAGVCTGLAVSHFNRSKQGCDHNVCGPDGLSERETARDFGDAASVTLIGGAALLGAAAVLFVTEPTSSTTEHVQLQAAPWLGPGALGLSLRGQL
jgi:hypothetical protein